MSVLRCGTCRRVLVGAEVTLCDECHALTVCRREDCGRSPATHVIIRLTATQGRNRGAHYMADFGILCDSCAELVVMAMKGHNAIVRREIDRGVHPRIASRRALVAARRGSY